MKKMKMFLAILFAIGLTATISAFSTHHPVKKKTQGWFVCNDPAHPLDAESYSYDEFETETCASGSGVLCRVYVTMNGTDPDEGDLADLSDKTDEFSEPIDDIDTGNKVRLKFVP